MTTPQAGTNPQKSRREMLETFVAAHPTDAFGRYGLAMECAQLGDSTAAEEHFRLLLASHIEYVAAYFQFGQMLARLGRIEEAQKTLREGIVVAARISDGHAQSEMQAALDEFS
jgi:hypothetical protein